MKSRHLTAWMFLTPMLLLLAVFAIYPLCRTFALSFVTQDLTTGMRPVFSGVHNYLRASEDTHFWQSVVRTLQFTFLAVGVELLLGLAAALALHRLAIGRSIARTALLVPWVLPTSALALAWIWIFNDQFGVANDLLLRSGIISQPLVWLGHSTSAFFTVVIADVWKTTPFITILLLAALQTVPPELYESAEMDGANRWQRFRHVTWPLIRPTVFIAVLFRMLQSFGIFDLIFVMTGGGPGGATETVAITTYRNFMRYLDFGYGAALLMISSTILLGMAALLWVVLGKEKS